MANTFKFGNGNWAVKDGYALAYNDENNNFKPLPFDFTRASSATRVNKQGLIETVPSGKPRIDFLNNTSGHLLLEPSRTNLINYSEAISNAPVKSGTFTDNFAISPDGTQNATKLTATNTDPYFYQSVAFTAGDYTASLWVKGIGGAIGKEFRFAISNETHSSNKYEIPSEWTRFEFTATITTGTFTTGLEIPDPAVSGDEVLVWGWQVEAGSHATSYIPTEGSSVTRVAEAANSAGNDSIFSEAEGVLYVESEALANDETSRVVASISNGSATTNRVVLQYTNNVGGNQVVAFAQTPSGYSSVLTRSITNALTFNKFAVVYNDSTNNFDLWVNGTKLGDGSLSHSFTANTLTTIQLADGNATNNPFYGRIKEVKVYNTALTDTELQALTT